MEKIQDVAVRYQGQFGLMSAKYHFRRCVHCSFSDSISI